MIDRDKRIEVESIGVGSVGYQPDHNPLIRRRWDKPGVKKMVPFEEIQEVMSSTGGYNLFRYHLLIKDPEVRKELDLPIDDKFEMYAEKDIEALLKGTSVKIKETLPDLPRSIQERVAQKAMEMDIDSVPKLKAIKEITGIDVYKMIEDKEESNKPK